MSRATRLASYVSWSAVDQVVFVGIPRLILYPILAKLLGDGAFGSFILAVSFIHMIGAAPSAGISAYIIREAANHNEKDRSLMNRTAALLCGLVTAPLGLLFVFGASWLSTMYDDPSLATMLPPLGVYLVFLNLVQTALTDHRVRRTFHRIAAVHAVQALLLFLAIPLYHVWGGRGLATAFPVAAAASFAFLIWWERRGYLVRPLWSPTFFRRAVRVWLPMSFSAILILSAGYLDRIVLGYWWPREDVAVFYAAVGTAAIFSMAGSQLSALVLSLLGAIKQKGHFTRRFYVQYVGGVWLFAGITFLVGSLTGEFLLSMLYPGLMTRALPLWNYAVGSWAVLGIGVGCRPFVVKFLSPKILPFIAAVVLLGRVIPILLLVPTGGRQGAVHAILIGSVITALVWFAVYLVGFVFPGALRFLSARQHASGPEPVNDSTEDSTMDSS